VCSVLLINDFSLLVFMAEVKKSVVNISVIRKTINSWHVRLVRSIDS
jgi:hypothetical protein